jgi:hypothetical protein
MDSRLTPPRKGLSNCRIAAITSGVVYSQNSMLGTHSPPARRGAGTAQGVANPADLLLEGHGFLIPLSSTCGCFDVAVYYNNLGI